MTESPGKTVPILRPLRPPHRGLNETRMIPVFFSGIVRVFRIRRQRHAAAPCFGSDLFAMSYAVRIDLVAGPER